MGAVALAEGVVEEPGQHMHLFAGAAQSFEKALLRAALDHKVGARHQQLRRHLNRLGVGHHAVGRLVQAQQHGHRDRPADQRVGQVRHHPLGVVGQQPRLDVAVDEEVAAQGLEQLQPGAGKGHVQLDLERRRSQHQAAHLGRVVMGPGGDQHRADALRQHHHVGLGDAMLVLQVLDEGLHVAHAGGKARAVAARAGDWPWPRASQAKKS